VIMLHVLPEIPCISTSCGFVLFLTGREQGSAGDGDLGRIPDGVCDACICCGGRSAGS